MSWQVYILKCADGSLYTGITSDLTKRMETHNAGKGAKYTMARLPVELLYSEDADDRSAASKRELEIKSYSREEKLKLISQ